LALRVFYILPGGLVRSPPGFWARVKGRATNLGGFSSPREKGVTPFLFFYPRVGGSLWGYFFHPVFRAGKNPGILGESPTWGAPGGPPFLCPSLSNIFRAGKHCVFLPLWCYTFWGDNPLKNPPAL